MRIAVLGAGSWGTALAAVLSDAGHDTALWGRELDGIGEMARTRENRTFLPGRRLREELLVTSDLAAAVADREMVTVAVPSEVLRIVAEQLRPHIRRGAIVACASKGLEEASRLTLDRVLASVLPENPIVMLSGPTFAREIAAGLPAAAVAASVNPAAAAAVQRAFSSDRFRVYTSDDVTGVAIGGALKNVIALAAGACDGLGFGSNARAALITRGLHEIGRLAARLGGNPLTLAGLAGLGDLVLTCTGELSRNRQVGLALAQGESLEQVKTRLGQVAEGIYTARIAAELARELGIEMPITTHVADVLEGKCSPREAVADLLSREQGPERG